jgi:D-tyrosyl-tRNA(Tyr) deacylase
MRALIQRVNHASVMSDQEILADIGQGLLIFLGVGKADTVGSACWMAEKISKLRIFNDQQGKMNRSVADTGGSILVVSQFTLYGDARRGNRPGFDLAAEPGMAVALYEAFCQELRNIGLPVQTGRFAAKMQVCLENDGPVTIWMEYPEQSIKSPGLTDDL